VLGRPDHLPGGVDVGVDELALEVEQEPPVAEVEVGVVAVRVHQLVHLRVEDLDEGAHVGEVAVHGVAVGEVLHHALHQVAEARVGEGLVVEDDQEGRHQVAHALHVADVEVLPHVGAHHVAQLVQILDGEVPVVAVAPLHVLLYPVQIQPERLQQFLLQETTFILL
jgi:hypothetical protein